MNSRVLLVLSLVVNLALAVVVIRRPAPAPAPVAAEGKSAAKAAPAKPEVAAAAVAAQKFDWRAVESEDYKKYIANLRTIGCPEDTIKDIIVADVTKLFEDRKKELKAKQKPAEKFKYWETGMGAMMRTMGGGGQLDEEYVKATQALAAEKRALIKELLGIEIQEKPDLFAGMNPYESMLDFLPSEKQTKVMELLQQYQAKMIKAIGDGGEDNLDNAKKMQAMQKEMEGELAKVLSPSELEDYQLRLSQTSMVMRMQLDGFNPTEQEYRDLFKLQKGFDDQFSLFGAADEDDKTRKAREAAKKELDEKVKATLGEARYAEYKRNTDTDYKNIAKAVKREGLDEAVGVKVYDMRKLAMSEADKLRADATLSAEDREAKLQAIRNETESAMITAMGQKGYDTYKKSANSWLNRIYKVKK